MARLLIAECSRRVHISTLEDRNGIHSLKESLNSSRSVIMNTEYVSQDEIEAHEAAMQRVVEKEKREQEAIGDRIKRAIKAAKMEREDEVNAAERTAEQGQIESKQAKEAKDQKLAAMQRDFERLPLLRQVYHEAPGDVFELIVSKCSHADKYGLGRGGLNAFRLANKRLQLVVESCITKLTDQPEADGPDSLPIPIIQRCGRIEKITCFSHNLRSVEGCPDGLKKLGIEFAPHLSDLSPLASCSKLESLVIYNSSISSISVVSSMPCLKVFVCRKAAVCPSIKDISPLSSCPMLKEVWLAGNSEINDLSPLSSCVDLECLCINNCPLIISLAPLSTLKNLEYLCCYEIHQTSLLPLASCTGLKELRCSPNAVDFEELKYRRPDIKINPLDLF